MTEEFILSPEEMVLFGCLCGTIGICISEIIDLILMW